MVALSLGCYAMASSRHSVGVMLGVFASCTVILGWVRATLEEVQAKYALIVEGLSGCPEEFESAGEMATEWLPHLWSPLPLFSL